MIRPISLAALLAASPALAEDRALVVGIDDYGALGAVVGLNGAAEDARRMARHLTETAGFAPEAVTLLIDEEATAEAILDALIDDLLGATGPGDRAVFYFAGMGTSVPGLDDGATTPALVAHDGDRLLGRIPAEAISDMLDIAEGREVTVVIDAGFDGPEARPGAVQARGLTPQSAPATAHAPFGAGAGPRAVWNAAGPGEWAWEDTGRGVFTDALLDGLGGAADADGDGVIGNAELLAHVTAAASGWCAGTEECGTLAPAFSGPAGPSALALPVAAPPEAGPPESQAEIRQFVAERFARNEANLRVGIDDAAPLALGDEVAFDVAADATGTMVLIDVRPDGQLMQLFPSRLAPQEGARIEAGQGLTIPSLPSANGRPLRVTVAEPAGEGLLLGLFAEAEPEALAALLPEGLTDGPVPGAGRHLAELAEALEAADGTLAWSAAHITYDIVSTQLQE